MNDRTDQSTNEDKPGRVTAHFSNYPQLRDIPEINNNTQDVLLGQYQPTDLHVVRILKTRTTELFLQGRLHPRTSNQVQHTTIIIIIIIPGTMADSTRRKALKGPSSASPMTWIIESAGRWQWLPLVWAKISWGRASDDDAPLNA